MDIDKVHEIEKRLAELNKIILSLDPTIRLAAFEILAPNYFDQYKKGRESKPAGEPNDDGSSELPSEQLQEFFGAFDHKKPKDNVLLIVAWLYSQHGVFPLTSEDIKNHADITGLTIPARPDNTMRYAKNKGKNLFRQHGDGWEPTVHGETYLKETYKVRKGSKPRPELSE